MCGIAGWFDLKDHRPCERALLHAMTGALAHRGPDGDGHHFEPGLGLGHRRLAVIDLATGAQPMLSPDKSICLVFNGEIYNFKELRRDLEQRGHSFTTQSDTEVILEAWREWGQGCVSHLTGMFAFALWDRRQETLFLARDRLGEKPLYYSILADQTFIFASELKGLRVHPDLDRTIDPCAVEEFFALGYIAEPRTIYGNVRQLPAGMSLTLRRGQKAQMQTYWDPKPAAIDTSELKNLDDALLERLGRIVKSQLVADVPVGAFLSGGVDSSGTMALMARQTQGPITAFTIGFNDRAFDETEYAAAVAGHYGSKHVIARMDGGETDLVESLPAIFDEPFGDSSALPSYRLMQLARKSVTVALSGDGGDELFAGYRRYGFHAREESIRRWLPSAIRAPLFGTLADLYPQLDRAPRFLRARHTFRELSADSTTGYFWNLSVVGDETRKSLFSQALTKSLGGYHAAQVVARHADAAPTDDPVTMAQYIDLKSWLPSDILTKVDRTAMANSLEVRVPMLDHTFVNWALGLPSAVNRRGGDGKILLKRAFARLVPPNVLHRPKQGFSVPLARWFRGTMGQHLDQKLTSKQGLASAHYLNPVTIHQLIANHQSGRSDNSRALWLIWMFEEFMEAENNAVRARPARTAAGGKVF
ncbi:MAG TPA: XrtA/PEP-CTERM system amidotransferase [Rhizomicrobium sp.]|nr:XrtA/PEP-CTERM system amidotransferase [Rhizomicrobium sp.]